MYKFPLAGTMTLRFCFPWILFRVLVSASPVVDRASSAKTLATGKRAEDFSSKLEARNLPQCYGKFRESSFTLLSSA